MDTNGLNADKATKNATFTDHILKKRYQGENPYSTREPKIIRSPACSVLLLNEAIAMSVVIAVLFACTHFSVCLFYF